MIIEDWTWSQVPPPILVIGPIAADSTHVIVGMADPSVTDDDGDLLWKTRRLTADQAEDVAAALTERAAALRVAAARPTGGEQRG